jgi:hypothetical protein
LVVFCTIRKFSVDTTLISRTFIHSQKPIWYNYCRTTMNPLDDVSNAAHHPGQESRRTSKALTSRVFEPKFKALVQEARLKRDGG